MDHYIDIRLRPDPESPSHHLMSALYSRLHRALVQLRCDDVGVSFPAMRREPPTLGDRLRLHGGLHRLQELQRLPWLGSVADHVDVSELAAVPPGARHRRVQRVQAKSNVERLRRRYMRRHGVDAATARERLPESVARTVDLPFVQVRSASTGQTFRMFLSHGPIQPEQVPGAFNAYGLSTTGTVPWF
ncbi:MAG: type I-F CRISPR-associated endoribonuclease Cas6/Csy4 [Pseudomonadota bacterium]